MKKLTFLIMALVANTLIGAPMLAPDPNLLVEKLDNGLTIAVYRNAEPPKRVSMRLLVTRGSAFETERERGIAHFIEHMAFNGTKHFPAGEMVEYFQRLGMAFGADTNAHTGFRETVYKLDMPEVSQKLVDDGLMLLRDYADSILFEQSAIDRERGVILAEKDSRDNQDYRKAVKEIGHYFKGSIYPNRMPIGEKDVIKNVNKADFQKFYRATYRPENIVLVIVGDVDAKEIASTAKKYFGDMKPSPEEPPREANMGNLETSDFEFDFGADSMPVDAVYDSTSNTPKSYASLSVAKELKNMPDSLEKRVEDYRIRALSNAISARYLRVADKPASKISQGSAGSFEFDSFCRVFIFNSEAPVTKFADALEENFRQLMSIHNITNAEIENAKKKIFDSIESEIKAKQTRKNQALANEITSAFSEGSVFTSPETDLEIAKYALKDFGAADAVKLLKSLFDGAKIKVFVSDTEAEMPAGELGKIAAAAFEKARKSTYDAEMFATESLIFTDFKTAGKISESRELPDLGITQMRFENGVRVNLKQTDFSKDEIMVKISFGNGIFDIPADRPEYFAALYALVLGGTKYQDASSVNAAKFLLKMDINVGMDGNSFVMTGASTKKDFSQMVRLAATMFADPGFREDGEESLMKYGQGFYLDYETSPMSRIKFLPVELIASPVARIPGTLKNFEKIKMKEIAEWLKPILKNSYMEISIVGDFDKPEAIELIKSTFGAMSAREPVKKDPMAVLKMKPLGENFSITYRTVDEPRSIAAVMWQSCGRGDLVRMRAANVLGAVLDDVLRKDVREKQGKVYSPFAYNNSSTWVKDFGLMYAMTFVVPSENADLVETLKACGKKVAASISEDEFERAKIPLLKGVEANKRKNEYWLSAVLNLSQAVPLNIELARTIETGYSDVTLDEVRKLAREIFARPPYSASVVPYSGK